MDKVEWVQRPSGLEGVHKAAYMYHYLCETFDRSITKNRSGTNGDALPENGWEREMMNQHAQRVLYDLVKIGIRDKTYDQETLLHFIRQYATVPYEQLEMFFSNTSASTMVV